MPKYKVTWTETTTRDWEDVVEAKSHAEAVRMVKELRIHGNPIAEPEFAGIIQKSIKAQEVSDENQGN
jgi:dTDP-glucose pyrophosphorylase